MIRWNSSILPIEGTVMVFRILVWLTALVPRGSQQTQYLIRSWLIRQLTQVCMPRWMAVYAKMDVLAKLMLDVYRRFP